MHVIIVGGGLAGLALALGLEKRGISYVVLERRLDESRRNWAVTITWSRSDLEYLLPPDIYEQLSQCLPDPTWFDKGDKVEKIIIKDGQNGVPIIQIPFPGVFRLNIQKTRKLWSKHVNIRYGACVVDISVTPAGPVAILEDGTQEQGTVIVGADGAGSRMRRWLLGDLADPEVLPVQMVNLSLKYTAKQAAFIESKIHPILEIGIHPKSMYLGVLLLDKPDFSKPETWTFYILASWPNTFKIEGEESLSRLEQLRLRIDDWAEPFTSAVKWIPDNTDVRPEVVKIWSPKQWDNRDGRVTIIGDAAHSMTWHRGQGANNGFADAAHFVRAIENVIKGEASLKEAIDAVDKDTRARGVKEVQISKTQTEASHKRAEYMQSPAGRYGVDQVK